MLELDWPCEGGLSDDAIGLSSVFLLKKRFRVVGLTFVERAASFGMALLVVVVAGEKAAANDNDECASACACAASNGAFEQESLSWCPTWSWFSSQESETFISLLVC